MQSTICKEHGDILPDGLEFIFGGTPCASANETIHVTKHCIRRLDDLDCGQHEEADTRLFAHLAYGCSHNNNTRGVIHATATDIIVLAMY